VTALLFFFLFSESTVRLHAIIGCRMVILQKRVPGLTEDTLDRFVTRAKRSVGLRGSVTVLVTSSRELRRLNQRFRGKDTPTDVLSFPALRLAAKRFAGDVAISADIASQNARRLGHSPAEEIKILALHGVLHLAGYDHETDNGAMARREERLRRQLRLPVGLIERNSAPKILKRTVRRERPQSSRRDASRPAWRGRAQ
jgi:probable rRNA maturation factor